MKGRDLRLALGLGESTNEKASIQLYTPQTGYAVRSPADAAAGAAAQGDTDAGEMVALPPTAYRLPVRSALACARGAPR